MACTLVIDGRNPSAEIQCPRYSTCDKQKEHFSFFNLIPASSSHRSTCARLAKWSSCDLPATRMSSIYTTTIGKSLSNVSMVRWKMAGVEATPKGILV